MVNVLEKRQSQMNQAIENFCDITIDSIVFEVSIIVTVHMCEPHSKN